MPKRQRDGARFSLWPGRPGEVAVGDLVSETKRRVSQVSPHQPRREESYSFRRAHFGIPSGTSCATISAA